MKSFSLIAGIILCLFIKLPAQSNTDFKTRNIAIFKNGTAFYQKSGLVKTDKGTYSTTEVPNALFGTLWFNSPRGELKQVSSYFEDLPEMQTAKTLPQLLKANVGKSLTLFMPPDTITGKLTMYTDYLITIQSAEGWVNRPTGEVKKILFKEQPKLEVEHKQRKQLIDVRFDNESQSQPLEMMYLGRGITWVPNYLIQLENEEKAIVKLRADVVNDGENVKDANLQFVVGVASFPFATQSAPLVSTQTVDQFLMQLYQAEPSSRFTRELTGIPQTPNIAANSIRTQQISVVNYSNSFNNDLPAATNLEEGATVQNEEDLYFYEVKDVNLPKNGKASFTLLSADMPISHVYESQLTANAAHRGFRGVSAENVKPSTVIHKLKIKNNTEQALTTGIAFLTSKSTGLAKPISQDQLKYTPPGGELSLTITESPDIYVVHTESEISRNENKKRLNRISYDLVTMEGELTVKNYKDKDVRMNVRRAITGLLVQSNQVWLKAPRTILGRHLNEITDVCWEFDLAAGEEKVVKYRYEVYIPR